MSSQRQGDELAQEAQLTPVLPRVSLITVNLDGRSHLGALFDSVLAQTYPQEQIEILLVDNASQDDSVAFVCEQYPTVRVIRNEQNQGFARPNNQAAAVATGELLALVNNDMYLDPDWLTTMVRHYLDSPEGTACVASRILNWDGSHTDFVGGAIALNGVGFQDHFNVPVTAPELRTPPQEVPFACGGAMLIERATFLTVGGFDEDFFAYVEDVDLGWRLWLLGYRIAYCAEATIFHRHNGTSSRFDWWRKFTLLARNALLVVYKNYDDRNLSMLLPAVLLLEIKRMAVVSEVPRDEFAFGSQVAMSAPLAVPSKESLIRRLPSEIRRYGFKHAVKKIAVFLAKKVIVRWGDRAYAHALESIPVRRRAYASIAAVEDFIDLLPKMRVKRDFVQSHRRRSDEEMIRIFGRPFGVVEQSEAYVNAHWLVLEQFGIKGWVEQALQDPSPVN